MDAVFLSILIEQQKEISPLREVLSADGRTIISNASKEHLQGALILIPSITTPLINNKLTL
jgi:hypothetical protein